MAAVPSPPVLLSTEFSALTLEVDAADGSPVALLLGDERLQLTTTVTLISGGVEVRAATGGLDYLDTTDVFLARGGIERCVDRLSLAARTYSVEVASTDPTAWAFVWHYEFRATSPRLAVSLEVRSLQDDTALRNLRLDVVPWVSEPSGWRVQAPGNKLRADLELASISYPSTVLTAAGVEGSTGIVGLERTGEAMTFVFWPLAQETYGEVVLSPDARGMAIEWLTDVAGSPGRDASLVAGPLLLDLVDRSFEAVLADVPDMLAEAGIVGPDSAPDWAVNVNLYEVQIGFGVFRAGHQYAPYPEARDLLDDLDRIQSLGYNALQVMPQQPYPSYNVHDFDDVSTSWGDEAVLREIVTACHDRGMRVIFDILMHGVIDAEAMDAAVAGIEAGPYAHRLDEPTPDVTTLERDEMHFYWVAWSRHVKDFEPYWRAGSPSRHRLVDEHPDWFTRDSAGTITGVYTQAFDLAHPGFQRYFIDMAVGVMQRMGIDGFRFDAPSYNYFMNWSDRTRTNASVSMLGCLPLFKQLRKEMRAANPESLLYTEPSGALYRVSMDVAYNYDEQWLVRAVMEAGANKAHWIRNARELGEWYSQRDASLPKGSLTAHHLDSHDTYWWPEPGHKWRREQYGAPATAALMAVFALTGGPFMTFVGGETGIEDEVRAVNFLRISHPAFARGTPNFREVRAAADDVYAVLRSDAETDGLLLVNLSDRRVTTDVDIPRQPDDLTTPDLLGSRSVTWTAHRDGSSATVTLRPFQASAFSLRQST